MATLLVQFVTRDEALIGLTDSDDIAAGQREGAPIAALPLTETSLLIPNTVAVIRHAPHPEAAQRLFEYLQRPDDVVRRLVEVNALESPSPVAPATSFLEPSWDALLQDLDGATAMLKAIFVR